MLLLMPNPLCCTLSHLLDGIGDNGKGMMCEYQWGRLSCLTCNWFAIIPTGTVIRAFSDPLSLIRISHLKNEKASTSQRKLGLRGLQPSIPLALGKHLWFDYCANTNGDVSFWLHYNAEVTSDFVCDNQMERYIWPCLRKEQICMQF